MLFKEHPVSTRAKIALLSPNYKLHVYLLYFLSHIALKLSFISKCNIRLCST